MFSQIRQQNLGEQNIYNSNIEIENKFIKL